VRVKQPNTPGQRIRQIRQARGLSQVEAARLAFISQAMWSSVELDEATPTIDKAHRIAAALGAKTEEIWPRDEKRS
jgi:transcriptional regulator with XRE-family HTH domain